VSLLPFLGSVKRLFEALVQAGGIAERDDVENAADIAGWADDTCSVLSARADKDVDPARIDEGQIRQVDQEIACRAILCYQFGSKLRCCEDVEFSLEHHDCAATVRVDGDREFGFGVLDRSRRGCCCQGCCWLAREAGARRAASPARARACEGAGIRSPLNRVCRRPFFGRRWLFCPIRRGVILWQGLPIESPRDAWQRRGGVAGRRAYSLPPFGTNAREVLTMPLRLDADDGEPRDGECR
jgi:hypothetical protein